jgi:hypothetical protein
VKTYVLLHRQEEEHEYDIVGHPQLNFSFVVVFPFHPYKDGRQGGEVSCRNNMLTVWCSCAGAP